jgi:hypothetical protein
MKTAFYYLRWALFFPIVVLLSPVLLLYAVGFEVDLFLLTGKCRQGLPETFRMIWHFRPKP